MRKRLKCGAVVLAVLVALAFNMTAATFGTQVETAKKFNVVFVLDASSSMNSTDPDGWRFDAIEQFLSLLSMEGNYAGAVTFNGDIVQEEMVSEITSNEDKDGLADVLKKTTPDGYTNIGAALVKANELLKSGDSSLPSIIILLSDGNTDMASTSKYEASIKSQKKAIEIAVKNGTGIYCVGLNANGRVKTDELKNISRKTGGKVKIVSKASDLSAVFKDFYKLIYGTGGIELDVKFSSKGTLEENFSVPKIGVEEVNILINGTTSKITLTQPSGIDVAEAELEKMMSQGKHFTNIKIQDPLSGSWKVKLQGDPGQSIKINFVPNLDLAVKNTLEEKQVYKRNENISISAQIVSKGEAVKEASIYQEYPATITVANANDADDVKTIDAVAEKNCYIANLKFDTVGTYYVTTSVDIGYGAISGETLEINVGNIPPQAEEDTFTYTKYAFGFGEKTYTYDLNELVSDEDGEKLSFKIDASTFDDEEISIEDGIVSVTPTDTQEDMITVIATDESGASCAFTIEFYYKSLLKVLLTALGIIIAVGAIAFFVIYRSRTRKPFDGSITVTAYDYDGDGSTAPMTEYPPSRPIDIVKINHEAGRIGGIAGTFYGSGKNYVTFKVKGTAYQNGRQVSKVKIYEGCNEQISSRADNEDRGVEITYMKQDNYY